jgi:hypothetical protein
LPQSAGGHALEAVDQPEMAAFGGRFTSRCTRPAPPLNSASQAPKSGDLSRMIGWIRCGYRAAKYLVPICDEIQMDIQDEDQRTPWQWPPPVVTGHG